MRRAARIVLGLLGSVVLLALLGSLWVWYSEAGTRWLLRAAEHEAGGRFTIGTIEGRLGAELTLRDLALNTESDVGEIAWVRASFQWGQLIAGRLVIDTLRAGPARFEHVPGGAAPTTAELPFDVSIESGSLERLSVMLGAEVYDFDTTQFAGRYRDGGLRIDSLQTATRGFEISVSGRLGTAPGIDSTLAVTWSALLAEQQWAGRGTLRGSLPEVEVEHELLAPYEIDAAGSVTLADEPRFDLNVSFTEFAWPEAPLVASGEASLSGSLSDFDFRSEGELTLADQRFSFVVAGAARPERVDIASLELTQAQAQLSASGGFDVAERRWGLAVAATGLDPSRLAPDWPGRLSARGNLGGGLEPELHLAFTSFVLEGELRGFDIQSEFEAAYVWPNRLSIARAEIRSGSDALMVSGTLGGTLDLDAEASLGRLDLLSPELDGRLTAELRVTGTRARPIASGRLSLDDWSYERYAGQRAVLSGTAELAGDVTLALDGSDWRAGPVSIDTISGRLEGTLTSHDLELALAGPDFSAALAAQSSFADETWRALLTRAELVQEAVGTWRLEGPTAMAVTPNTFVIDELCLSQGGADVCAALQLVGTSADWLTLHATDFDLRTLDPFLSDAWSARGSYEIAASFMDLSGAPRGTVSVAGASTEISFTASPTDVLVTAFDSVRIAADLENRGLSLQASLDGGEAGRVDLAARFADVGDRDAEIEARLEVLWSELGFASLASPDIGAIEGSMQVALDLTGSANNPQLQGRADWRDGSVEVPAWGVRIDRIDATATSPDGTELQLDAVGWLGEGQLSLTGSSRLDPASGWPTQLFLSGDSVLVAELPEAQVFVSPALDINVDLPNVRVVGDVHVPRASLSLDELPEQAVQTSSDVIVHGVEQPAPVRPLNVAADIRLTLGDDVKYTGSNLNAELGGEINVRYASGQAANASGSLTIAGSYDAFGQSLDLDRGELIFAGPLDDPALDVRAVRSIEEITVGVQVNGTLKSPQTRMFSDPQMSEADALSYLLLGRPLAGSGDEESATVQSAAIAMGLQQALPVVQRIGETLGFDEFAIEANDVDTGALMAGKYLSPKLYMRYSYGLFNRIGGLLLRFRVNERLSIETRSGDQESMDVLYTVEKD